MKNTINKGQEQAQSLRNMNKKCRGNPLRLPIIKGLWDLGGEFGFISLLPRNSSLML